MATATDFPEVPCITKSPQTARFPYRRSSTVDRDPRALYWRWRRETWTRKSCAICGRPQYQLHHARYHGMPSLALLHVVPLCEFHHADFSNNVWPLARKWLSLTEATLAYVVNGERLHQWTEWLVDEEPPAVGINRDQLSLLRDVT